MSLKKSLLCMAAALLAVTMAPGVCKAAEDEQDPLYYKYHLEATEEGEDVEEQTDEAVLNTHDAAIPAAKFDGYYYSQGIDVSYYQQNIDWEKVAADQIEYAIIRVGYTRYSADYKANHSVQCQDVDAITNLQSASAAGLPVGAYMFSQAITEEEAVKEADYAVKIVKKSGVSLELPIVFDFEYVGTDCRLYQAGLTATEKTKICKAFCDEIKAKGYTPMITANYTMLTYDLKAASLDKNYLIWLAHYTTSTSYPRPYQYWQFCSDGFVDGITGYVDMDYHFIQPVANEEIEVASTTLKAKAYESGVVKLYWTPIAGVTGYYIEKYNPETAAYEQVATLKGSTTSSWKDTDVECSTKYKYRIRCYKIRNDQVGTSDYSNVKSVTSCNPVDAITLTSSVQVYEQADANSTVLAVLGKKADVSLMGISGSWYKISFLKNNQTVTGYVLKSVVTKKSNIPSQVTVRVYPKAFYYIKLKWNASEGAEGYRIDRYDEELGKYVKIAIIRDPSVTYYCDRTLEASTSYTYRVWAFRYVNGYALKSQVSESKTAETPAVPKAKTNTKVNLRRGPSVSYSSIGTLKSNKKVQILGVSGSWYKVKVTVNGVRRTGYIAKKYITLL